VVLHREGACNGGCGGTLQQVDKGQYLIERETCNGELLQQNLATETKASNTAHPMRLLKIITSRHSVATDTEDAPDYVNALRS
jgi:hypothetical protein